MCTPENGIHLPNHRFTTSKVSYTNITHEASQIAMLLMDSVLAKTEPLKVRWKAVALYVRRTTSFVLAEASLDCQPNIEDTMTPYTQHPVHQVSSLCSVLGVWFYVNSFSTGEPLY